VNRTEDKHEFRLVTGVVADRVNNRSGKTQYSGWASWAAHWGAARPRWAMTRAEPRGGMGGQAGSAGVEFGPWLIKNWKKAF
jgi:hypothetical protein